MSLTKMDRVQGLILDAVLEDGREEKGVVYFRNNPGGMAPVRFCWGRLSTIDANLSAVVSDRWSEKAEELVEPPGNSRPRPTT